MPTYELSENITKALKESGLKSVSNPPSQSDSLWDCHGNWILKHKACEKIAADKGITFDEPIIIESNAEKNIAVVVVTGYLGDRMEWSFGEATPKNSKNSYPYAMAEKRAKDRVILKLIGLHGDVYSESESDDFVQNAKTTKKEEKVDTSVWQKVGKKAGIEARNELNNYYATYYGSQNPKKKKEAFDEATRIYKWANKHELVIISDMYLNLFKKELEKSA